MRAYRFGVFLADVRAGELRKNGVRVKLQDRPFQLLLALLQAPGEVVTRSDLRQRFWPAGTYVDFDHSISSTVNKLRTALNDSASHPRYIETVGRRGYRFLADVKPIPSSPAPEVRTHGESRQPPAQPWAPPGRWRWIAISLGIVATAGLLGWYAMHSRGSRNADPVKLAVLPFRNLTGDPQQEYFSDGLTEEVINHFGHLDPDHLAIVSLRSSSPNEQPTTEQLKKITTELGIQYLLHGSVRREANKFRITLRLVQTKDQTQLWTRQYDRDLTDVLALQAEIAQEVADEVPLEQRSAANSATRRVPALLSPHQYEAYDLYLKGRYYWDQRSPESFQKAVASFQQAIAKDPNFARAYAGLADTYVLQSTYYLGSPKVLIPKAREAALKALSLDENLSEAHTSLALLIEVFDWDWQASEKEFKRAIQLDPGYATAHQWYAEFLAFQGRFNEAYAESERARQLDPLSSIIAADHCAISYFSRQYDRALKECGALLEVHPHFGRAQVILLGCYTQQRRFADAVALAEQHRHIQGEAPWIWAWESYIYGRSGQMSKARQAFRKMLDSNERWKMDPAFMVTAYLGTGDKERAMAALEQAFQERSSMMTGLKVDPSFDPLREDPRFQKLLHHVNLAP